MANSGTIDDLYLEWLYGQIADLRITNPRKTYWQLIRHLYQTPFKWVIANDDNREADGKYLRDEFLADCDIEEIESSWLVDDCSMLEMLIALARRSSFESHGTTGDWFWKFLENLGVIFPDDHYTEIVQDEVSITLDRVNNRTYEPNGVGGLFPLKHAQHDQRNVELWYQLSAYLVEGEYVDHGPY